MVSIVTGNGWGLFNSSRDVLGAAGEFGQAASGRAGERVTVNAANGNVVIQNRDEYLVGVGPDVGLLRTYNSSGAWDGDNNDGWRIGYYRRVFGFDANAGVVKRTDADGHETAFYLNASAGKYFTAEGAGSFDSLTYNSATQTWTWTDGDTGVTETYETIDNEANYRLTQVTDTEGGTVKVRYDAAGLLSRLETWKSGAAYETVTLNYGANRQLTAVATSYHDTNNEVRTRTLTRYDYNSTSGRLERVTTDLTPEDATDDKTYTVSYGYDANGRLQTITQKDGSQQSFEYWGDGRVKSVTEQTVTEYWPDGRVKTVVDKAAGALHAELIVQ